MCMQNRCPIDARTGGGRRLADHPDRIRTRTGDGRISVGQPLHGSENASVTELVSVTELIAVTELQLAEITLKNSCYPLRWREGVTSLRLVGFET